MSAVGPTLLVTLLAGNLLMLLCGVAEAWLELNIDRLFAVHSGYNISFYVYIPMLIGQIIGSFVFPLLSELIGRKYTLLIIPFPLTVGLLLTEFLYGHYIILIIGRSLMGLFVGGSQSLLPIYFSEISEANTRGKFISSLYTSYLFGIFLVIILSLLRTSPVALTIIGILFSVVYFVMFAFMAPESPYYYLKKFRTNELVFTLNKLRNTQENTQNEIADMQRKQDENKYSIDNNERLIARLNLPPWVKSSFMVLTVVVVHVFILFSIRIEFIAFILASEGNGMKIFAGLSAFLRILASCLCLFLVDKIGRKLLLIISYGGVAVSFAFFVIVSIVRIASDQEDPVPNTYLFGFPLIASSVFSAMGAQPISLILIGELFSLRLRMLGSAISTTANFAMFTVLSFATNLFYFSLPLIVWFLLVIFVLIAMILNVQYFFLETKGMSLQQIQISLNKKNIIHGHRLDVDSSRALIGQSQL